MKKAILILILLLVLIMNADETELLYDDTSVAEVNITVDEEALAWMYENVWSDSLHLAEVHFLNAVIDETLEDVGFRLRGNTSRLAYKKSFKLSFNDFVPGREFYGVDKMNLNGEHNDPSIIRSKLCWDLYEEIGMKSSRASHLAVYINEEYYGLYISVEHIDDEFLEKNFSDASGNLWKCHYPARLDYLGDDPDLYKFEVNGQRVYELKRNEEEDDYSELARFIDIINNTPAGSMPDSLEHSVDIAGVLRYLAMDVLTGSWDDYWYGKNNFYIYHEPSEDKFYIIPFDYDNTFGVDWAGIDWTERDIYQFKHPDANRPLADVFMEDSQYRNLYSHFLEFYAAELYELPVWESRIDSLKDMITPWAEIDSFRVMDYGFTMDDFHDSYTAESYENQHVTKGLKEFINQRYESVMEQMEYLPAAPVVYEVNWETPQPQDSVLIRAAAFSSVGLAEVNVEFYPEEAWEAEIFSMVYEPVSDTKKVEEADRWQVSLPSLEDSYGYIRIRAIDSNGLEQVYPRGERLLIEPSAVGQGILYINEFLAVNDETNFDEAGEYDDWVEIYNSSSQSVDLSGYYLSDNANNPDKWQFAEAEIEAESYLLVWCDDDEEQGYLHTNFKLSGDGEYISLTSPDGISVIDFYSFGEQTADVSMGRVPDGGENWEFMQPSPAEANINTGNPEDDVAAVWDLRIYPNPFNPETCLEFELGKAGKVTVAVYNVKGQQVDTLTDEYYRSGKHRIFWQAEKIPSGIYLLKMTMNGSESTRKLCLIK